jgi:GT2 family glycosyltransferase
MWSLFRGSKRYIDYLKGCEVFLDNLASIIIVTYNHKKYLNLCIQSIHLQDYPCEIILVDNGSNDGTPDFVENFFPDVKVIRNKNTGYGAGNNLGVSHSEGKYIVLLNPDTIVEKNWLREIIEPLRKNDRIITTPKILMYDGLSINTCGNINHFSGLTFTQWLGEAPNLHNECTYVTGFSGACFAMEREDYVKTGGFDENFFLYNEDSEFSWRTHLLGFKILFVPTALVRHDYKIGVSPEKLFYLELGRYRILKKYISLRNYAILCPSLLIVELIVLGYSLKCGYRGIYFKLKAIIEGLSINSDSITNLESNKILRHLNSTIPINQLESNKFERLILSICNKIFKLNYSMVR